MPNKAYNFRLYPESGTKGSPCQNVWLCPTRLYHWLDQKSNNTKQDFQDSNPKEMERTAIRPSAPYTFFRLCVNLL